MSDHSIRIIRIFLTSIFCLFMIHSVWVKDWAWLIWEIIMLNIFWQSKVESIIKKKNPKLVPFYKYSYAFLCFSYVGVIYILKNNFPDIFYAIFPK